VLGVAAQRAGAASVPHGVAEDVDKSEVIASCDKVSVLGGVNSVDVAAIGASGVDTLNVPSELNGVCGPIGASSVAAAVGILRPASGGAEEEKFVGTTVGADVRTILGPVQSHHVTGVAGKSRL